MAETKKPVAPGPPSASDRFSMSGILEKKTSLLNGPVWRLALTAAGLMGFAWTLPPAFRISGAAGFWAEAVVLAAAWITALRLLFLETRFKKFWSVLLALSLIFVLFFNYSSRAWAAAVCFSFLFLFFRRYRPYRHLTSRRRAILFLIYFAALVLSLAWTAHFPAAVPSEGAAGVSARLPWPTSLALNIAVTCLWSLRFFLFFSLIHIFFGARLHFMKLKPKLAFSAFLLLIVPLCLLLIMGIIILYGVLGESLAVRANSVLASWADFAASDGGFLEALSDKTFTVSIDGAKEAQKEKRPARLSELLEAVRKPGFLSDGPGRLDRAFYFGKDSDLWLLSLRGKDSGGFVLRGAPVDQRMMDRLASVLKTDVILSASNPINIGTHGRKGESTEIRMDASPRRDIIGTYKTPGSPGSPALNENSIWRKRFYFGMTHMDMHVVRDGRLKKLQILLILKTSIADIWNGIFSSANPLGTAIMAGIAFAAVLMLLLEIFALVFGLRITAGITSAVTALHKGVRRIEAGDFDTPTVVPNEDELGDLAIAFNEMAAAVKRGRDEAIAREQLERELRIAREIQERLLPHAMPQIPGFEISGTSLPSQQVGGDYFDFLDMESGHLGIAIADVSGKGIPAALLMANLQASLHGQAAETGDISKVVSRMNNLLARFTDSHMFATFFYGLLDRGRRALTYVNAGHNPPFHFHADGSYERLGPGGLLIGFLPDQSYEQKTFDILPGEVLVFFTDGITEAVRAGPRTDGDKHFGEDRLIQVIRRNLSRRASGIQEAVLEAVAAHTAGAPQSDDITLVVIKRRAEGPER